MNSVQKKKQSVNLKPLNQTQHEEICNGLYSVTSCLYAIESQEKRMFFGLLECNIFGVKADMNNHGNLTKNQRERKTNGQKS
jgi:hypothetical protein